VPALFWPVAAGLAGLVGWAFWPSLAAAADRWATDPQYSHGYLVPAFSAYLLWSRRRLLGGAAVRPADLAAGFGLLAAGTGLRWFGTVFFYNGLDLLALLPTLAGAALVAGGRPALRWAWPAVLFLAFMVPLPFQFQTALAGRLQRAATVTSTFALQTVGTPAVAEGNVILIDDDRVEVAEACSGLGMMVTFAALAFALALVVRSALWVRVLLVFGALPVAVAANVLRIAATGLFFHLHYGEAARAVFHDLAGWLMMPVGAALLLAERSVLDRLVVDADDPDARRGGPLPILARPAAR
jgi:exosortase